MYVRYTKTMNISRNLTFTDVPLRGKVEVAKATTIRHAEGMPTRLPRRDKGWETRRNLNIYRTFLNCM